MKTCEEALEAAMLQVAGETDRGLDPAIQAHLVACANCNAEVRRLGAVLHDARGGEVPDPGAVYWAAFGERLRGRIRRARAARRRQAFLGLAAATLAALGLGLFAARHGAGPAPGAVVRAAGTGVAAGPPLGPAGRETAPAVDNAEARLEEAIRRAARQAAGRSSFEAVLDDVIPADPLVMDGDMDLPDAPVPGTPGAC